MNKSKDEKSNLVTKEDFKKYFYERSEVNKEDFIKYQIEKRDDK